MAWKKPTEFRAENQISSDHDFPSVKVYMDMNEQGAGPIISITFENLEFEQWKISLQALATLGLMVLFIPACVAGVQAGPGGLLLPIIVGAAFIWSWRKTMGAFPVNRTIALDFGRDEMRVLKNGKAEQQLPLRWSNLTVEDHPEAEYKRNVRLERGKKELTNEEKSHCLVGWFGPGGANRVMLLCRAEWPDRKSLFEVKAAMEWVMGWVAKIEEEVAKSDSGPETIKPPLD